MIAVVKGSTNDLDAPGKRALLDAAETIFAEHGYYGAAMREITTAAEVPHGLASYHFRTKDELFKAVVARRVPDIMALLEQGLQTALSTPTSGLRRVKEIIDAYIGAHLDFAARGEAETSYVRLAQQLIAVGKRRLLVAELTIRYDPVYEKYLQALAEAMPQADAEFLRSRFHLTRLVLAGVQVDIDLPPPLSRKRNSEAREVLSTFCANGFRMDR